MKSGDYQKIALFTIVSLIIIYFPYFLGLGDLPIRIWDESRLIANAQEMFANGNYLIPHFNGEPEMWNTKPPLMIWAQVLSMNLFGNQEMAFRFPSALAGALTCILLLIFSFRYLKSFVPGFVAVLILVTSQGHTGFHVTRTGDYDALLTFFMVSYLIFFFLWSETGKKAYLHLFFAGVVLAVYTKSIQGLLFLPAILIYILVWTDKRRFFKEKWVYFDSLLTIGIILLYYLGRESVNPGYLKSVWVNEIGGRAFNTMENHAGGPFHYLDLLLEWQFSYYLASALAGIFCYRLFKEENIRRLIKITAITSLVYLFIISAAKTKLDWYTAPVIPVLAILAAMPVILVSKLIKESENPGFKSPALLTFALIFILFAFPYYQTVNRVYKEKEAPDKYLFYITSYYLRDGLKGRYNLDNHKLAQNGYNVHIDYYINRLKERGISIEYFDMNRAKQGDTVIYSLLNGIPEIEGKFSTKELSTYNDHLKVVILDSIKQNP